LLRRVRRVLLFVALALLLTVMGVGLVYAAWTGNLPATVGLVLSYGVLYAIRQWRRRT